MSLEVKCFDEKGAEAELAKCPQIVKDYVNKLKGSTNNWKNICADALNKLRNASKNNGALHSVSVSESDIDTMFPYEDIENARPTRPEQRIRAYNSRQADRREGAKRLLEKLHSR